MVKSSVFETEVPERVVGSSPTGSATLMGCLPTVRQVVSETNNLSSSLSTPAKRIKMSKEPKAHINSKRILITNDPYFCCWTHDVRGKFRKGNTRKSWRIAFSRRLRRQVIVAIRKELKDV